MNYRVCYVTTVPGTLELFFLDSAKYNIENGKWDVTFVSGENDEFESRLPNNIKYIPLKLVRGYTFSDIHECFKLIKILREGEFDLIEYATTKASLYASIAAKIAHIPIRVYGQLGISYTTYHGIKRFVVRAIEKMICNKSTNIYAVCKENLDIAIQDGLIASEKGFVVGHGSSLGVDLERFDVRKKRIWRQEIRKLYGVREDEFLFGYVGMLRKEKGLDELFDAYHEIRQEKNNTKLMIIGDNSVIEGINKGKIERAIRNDSAIFTGKIKEVEKYYAAFDCFVFPSYHEGFGNVTIEAEAMEIPIVATDIPGTRTAMINNETGILVPSKNYRELKKGMLILLESDNLREKFSKNGRRYVEKYFDKKELCKWIYDSRLKLLENKQ